MGLQEGLWEGQLFSRAADAEGTAPEQILGGRVRGCGGENASSPAVRIPSSSCWRLHFSAVIELVVGGRGWK